MPRKKEKYSTLDQIVNALLKKEKLDDSKYQELQNAIKNISASNINETVRSYLSGCLKIKLEIDGLLLAQLNPIATVDKINELNQEVKSINKKIDLIDTNSINLKSKRETKEVKTKINCLKELFKPKIEEFEKKLKMKENEFKEKKERAQEKESQEQSSASSSSDQSLIKKTGAVPKEKSVHKEKRHKRYLQEQKERQLEKKREQRTKQEAEELQKERERDYSDFKEKLIAYLKVANYQIIFSLFRDIKEVYNKRNNVPKTVYISEKNYKKFDKVLEEHIKAYYFTTILNQLLEKDCIIVDLQKYKNSGFDISKCAIMPGDKITVYFKKIQDTILKLGFTVSKYLDCIPNVENIKDIENNLVAELPNLYESLLREQLKTKSVVVLTSDEGIVNLITPQNVNSAKTAMNDVLYDKVVCSGCNGKKYISGFLEEVMKKNGYKEKVDKVLEELIKQHSPNSSMEELSSLQGGVCAQVRR